MKKIVLILNIFVFFACNNSAKNTQDQTKNDVSYQVSDTIEDIEKIVYRLTNIEGVYEDTSGITRNILLQNIDKVPYMKYPIGYQNINNTIFNNLTADGSYIYMIYYLWNNVIV